MEHVKEMYRDYRQSRDILCNALWVFNDTISTYQAIAPIYYYELGNISMSNTYVLLYSRNTNIKCPDRDTSSHRGLL